MAPTWEIVGGADKGGILVRKGQDLKSAAESDRLSTGASVEQVALAGDRLHYKLLKGTGPSEGWISVRISGKELAVLKGTAPAAVSGTVADPPAAAGSEPLPSKIKEAAPWLKPVFKPAAQARKRLVMFTWTGNRGGAGSAHDFREWEKIMAEDSAKDTWEVCKVEYPGRGPRVKDPNATSAAEVAAAVADALDKAGALGGTVLFGFSFGAILAYETAVLLAARGKPVEGLVVASVEHPGWTGRASGAGPDGGPTKDMNDAAFEDMLRKKGGTDFILRDEDMKKRFLPVIRSDMLMEESYGAKPPENPQLECPLVVFRGKKCPQVSREDAQGWLKCTKEGKRSRVEELDTGLEPNPGAPWLSDWYLCQGPGSANAMAKAIAADFGTGK